MNCGILDDSFVLVQSHDSDDFTINYAPPPLKNTNNHYHNDNNVIYVGNDDSGDGGDASKYDSSHRPQHHYYGNNTLLGRIRNGVASVFPVMRGTLRARTTDCQTALQEKTGGAANNHNPIVTNGTGNSSNLSLEPSFYQDTFNDESWVCSFGTHEEVSNSFAVFIASEVCFVFRCSHRIHFVRFLFIFLSFRMEFGSMYMIG